MSSYIHCPACHAKVGEYIDNGKRVAVCHSGRCTYLDHSGATECPNPRCKTVVRVQVPKEGKK